eukprot:1158086-Pelagomonas_calceolata.AAC.4
MGTVPPGRLKKLHGHHGEIQEIQVSAHNVDGIPEPKLVKVELLCTNVRKQHIFAVETHTSDLVF